MIKFTYQENLNAFSVLCYVICSSEVTESIESGVRHTPRSLGENRNQLPAFTYWKNAKQVHADKISGQPGLQDGHFSVLTMFRSVAANEKITPQSAHTQNHTTRARRQTARSFVLVCFIVSILVSAISLLVDPIGSRTKRSGPSALSRNPDFSLFYNPFTKSFYLGTLHCPAHSNHTLFQLFSLPPSIAFCMLFAKSHACSLNFER